MGRDLRAAVSNCDQDRSWDLEMRLLLKTVGLRGRGGAEASGNQNHLTEEVVRFYIVW